MRHVFFALIFWLALGGCEIHVAQETAGDAGAREETADEFVSRLNDELHEFGTEVATTNWVRATYINQDTALLASRAAEEYASWQSRAVAASLAYEGKPMSAATARALKLLRLATAEPAPSDPARRKELADVATELAGMYGTGKYCPADGRDCMSLTELSKTMAESRDYEVLLDAWAGWRTVSAPMRAKYRRFVELTNEGASEFGYSDLGEMWRDGYDMPPAAFESETARLWEQVQPLYEQLHCHVRAVLSKHYGDEKVPPEDPIPAHLLGNMWAQDWIEIFDLVTPYPEAAAPDIDRALVEQGYDPERMVRSAEEFYMSLGLRPLPDTFWERSLLEKPAGRDVQCHPSAWSIDWDEDLRIKMCIEPTFDDLHSIYHELGHVYYFDAYREQPPLFQQGAHDGFHEAIGYMITLSMTPGYLARVGLTDAAADSEQARINRLMLHALEEIAFLPFGKLIDEWRWGVFAGRIAPDDYNAAWWELREKYQGVAAPIERSEADFDPGAKYHVPANTPYTRYFLARILMFQFQRALCDAAGHDGPLDECSIYGSETAGERLDAMLSGGASAPWQDAMEKMTGTREMDASAIIDYFQPLMAWLEQQNSGRSCGW